MARNHIFMCYMAEAHLIDGQFDAAVSSAKKTILLRPDYLEAHIILASSLGYLERSSEARQAFDGVLKIEPNFKINNSNLHQFRKQIHIDLLADGLRRAGLLER